MPYMHSSEYTAKLSLQVERKQGGTPYGTTLVSLKVAPSSPLLTHSCSLQRLATTSILPRFTSSQSRFERLDEGFPTRSLSRQTTRPLPRNTPNIVSLGSL